MCQCWGFKCADMMREWCYFVRVTGQTNVISNRLIIGKHGRQGRLMTPSVGRDGMAGTNRSADLIAKSPHRFTLGCFPAPFALHIYTCKDGASVIAY